MECADGGMEVREENSSTFGDRRTPPEVRGHGSWEAGENGSSDHVGAAQTGEKNNRTSGEEDAVVLPNGRRLVRYYEVSSHCNFDEDELHEFKGHYNICEEEMPYWVYQSSDTGRMSRQPLSKAINAFVNTGKGGTVFIGIMDNGLIKGVPLTRARKDHVLVSIDDLLSRYSPPVPQHRYRVLFIPALELDAIAALSEGDPPPLDATTEARRAEPHLLRCSAFCWCDGDNISSFNRGVVPQSYVIEVHLLPWDSDDPRNGKLSVPGNPYLAPIHENECGDVYIRCAATVKRLGSSDVSEQTTLIVRQHLGKQVHQLQVQMLGLLREIAELRARGDGVER